MNLLVDELIFKKLDQECFPLADRFYSNNKYKVRCGKLDQVYILRTDQDLVASLRLTQPRNLREGSDYLLLRNLCVAKEHRGQGIARKLMRSLTQELTYDLYLFSLPHLTDFYLSLGFSKSIINSEIPLEILNLAQTYQARHRDWVLMKFAMGLYNDNHCKGS